MYFNNLATIHVEFFWWRCEQNFFLKCFVCGRNGVSKKVKTTLKWKLSYLLAPFPYLFLYIYVSLFISFSGVAFHRPLISLSLFLSFFLGTSSNRFLFSGFSRCQSTNKIVTRFLSFFLRPFNLPIQVSVGKAVLPLCITDTSHLLGDLLGNWLVWFFLFANSTFPLPRILWASWPIGIQPSNRSLITRDFLLGHTPILRELDR